MNLFQTSLYVFSSLLQADAAILGFGAIFIIYKMQSIENIRQNIIQMYWTKGPGFTGNVNTLILDNPETIADLLNKEREAHHFENYKYIVCIPAKTREIGKSIKLPVAVIGVHTILCGILLYLGQFIFQCEMLWNSVLIIGLAWFALGIFLASKLAIDLLTRLHKYRISELRPDIFKFVPDKNEARWHNG